MTPTLSPLTRQHWQAIADRVSAAIPEGDRLLSDPPAGSWLINGDVFDTLDRLTGQLSGQVAAVFADPPYFVGKDSWDRRRDVEAQLAFSEEWLAGCRELLTESGSLWVAGGFRSMPCRRLCASTTWDEGAQPRDVGEAEPSAQSKLPELRARHRKRALGGQAPRARYRFNYDCMRQINGGKQMHSHWRLATAPRAERALRSSPDAEAGSARRALPAGDDAAR